MEIKTVGALAFGFIIGWYVYYVNRYRKGDVQFSDITTLVGAIGGGALLKLFDPSNDPKAALSPELFGWYGLGLAAGFFAYFFVLVALVKKSVNFDADWFLDGRRKNPGEGVGYGTDAKSTITPFSAAVRSDQATLPASGSIQNFYVGSEKVPVSALGGNVEWLELAAARPRDQRVAEAKRLLAEGKVYPRGCSEFVCAVLGIPYEVANELMGDTPLLLGPRPPYTGLVPGDIAGWVASTGMGHVTIFVGESDSVAFIDVREPGAKPRSKNAFYDRDLYKSSRF